MASLTPLSKGLIALAVVGAMASAVWHLVLKERIGGSTTGAWQTGPTPAAPNPKPASPAQPAPAPVVQSPGTAAPKTPGTAIAVPNSGLSAAENFDAGRRLMAAGDYGQARKHL